MSPTTTSETCISCSAPSRRILVISLDSSSALRTLALPSWLCSETEATPLASRMAISTHTGSYHSARPMIHSTTWMASATSRIMIIGSLKPSSIFFHSGSGGI